MLKSIAQRLIGFPSLSIYTDGACSNNGAPSAKSAYGFYCLETKHSQAGSGEYEGKHTNNTGELMAIFRALEYAKGKTKRVRIFSDSRYSIDSLTVWRLHPGKKNYALIYHTQELIGLFEEVEFEWIKGHHVSKWNEYADHLATEYLLKNKK